jgi:hypothetical protein
MAMIVRRGGIRDRDARDGHLPSRVASVLSGMLQDADLIPEGPRGEAGPGGGSGAVAEPSS